MDNVVGVIDKAMSDYGFAFFIDRSYAGKTDDVSSIFYYYSGSEEDFEKICKELNIGLLINKH